jgi:signal transduction histidine kinase
VTVGSVRWPGGGPATALVPAAAFTADLFLSTDWPAVRAASGAAVLTVAVIGYLIVGSVLLVRRHGHPRVVFGLVAGWAALGPWVLPMRPFVTLLVALYAVAVDEPAPRSAPALALSALPVASAIVDEVSEHPGDEALFALLATAGFTGMVVVVWLAGWHTRRTRHRVVELEEAQADVAHRAIAEERRRLAGELHDIVSHAVTVIVLQAAGARTLVDDDGGELAVTLDHIEGKGREAMAELRRLLGVMRSRGDVPTDDGDQRGLGDLGALTRSIEQAGVRVDVRVEGAPRPVDPSIDLTAYRVVQEALTNTLGHAGPGSHATVDVRWGTSLVLDVADTGGPHPSRPAGRLSTGTGLIGLEERVCALGGAIRSGRRDGGPGYRVHVELPLAQVEAATR